MEKNIDLFREDYTDFNKYYFFKRLKTRIYKVIIVAFGLLWFIAGTEIYAQEISISGAEKAANTWLANEVFNMNYQLDGNHNIKNKEGEMLAYRFDLQPQGYLVLTAYQSLPPVIAYSFTGNFSIADNQANPLEDMLIQDIKARLAHLPNMEHKAKEANRYKWNSFINDIIQKRTFEQWPPQGSTSTGGWLETNWSQSAPYNNLCPLDEVTGMRSVAGCPAIALAMIIHYQKNLNVTQFSDDDDYYHNYSGRQYWIDDDSHEMDFPAFPVLNEYFDSIAVKFPAYIPLNTDEIPYNLTIIEGAVMDIGISHVGMNETTAEDNSSLAVYPNPSSGPVNICPELSSPGNVQVEVRDVSGRLVRNIYSGWLNKGYQTFVW